MYQADVLTVIVIVQIDMQIVNMNTDCRALYVKREVDSQSSLLLSYSFSLST